MPESIAIGSVGVTLAVVELIKRTAAPPKRWLPLIAVVVAILLNLFAATFGPNETPTTLAIFAGLIAGLSAAGLYDTVKGVTR